MRSDASEGVLAQQHDPTSIGAQLRSFALLLGVVLLVVVSVPVSAVAWAHWRNDRATHQWAQTVAAATPPGAVVVSEDHYFGVMDSGPSECNRWTVLVVRTGLTPRQVASYYRSHLPKHFGTVFTGVRGRDGVVVELQGNASPPGFDNRCWQLQ